MTPVAIVLTIGVPLAVLAFLWEHVIHPALARRRIVRKIRDSSWHGPRH